MNIWRYFILKVLTGICFVEVLGNRQAWYQKQTLNSAIADVSASCVMKCAFQFSSINASVIEVQGAPCTCSNYGLEWYDDPIMSPGRVYLAKRRLYESFKPPVLVGPTHFCHVMPVPFSPDTGSSFKFVFTPKRLNFNFNLNMDANNSYIHVAIRNGYILLDYYKDGAWRSVPADTEYPGIVGQVQELTLEIHSDHCQVFVDNTFLGQSGTPQQASKITSLAVCPENSAVVELHSVDCKSAS